MSVCSDRPQDCPQTFALYVLHVLRPGQLMTEATRSSRLNKAKKLLSTLKNPKEPYPLIFFSDQKNFSQDHKVNTRNSSVSAVTQPTFLLSWRASSLQLTVIGVVSSEGHVMPPHFFPKGLWIAVQNYLSVLRDVIKPWMDQIADGCHYIFQQDSTLAHSAIIVQNWCGENLPEF